MIPPVVASERGTAQTVDVARRQRGCRTATLYANREQNTLEKGAPKVRDRKERPRAKLVIGAKS